MRLFKPLKSSDGDTIIEVLIAITVLATVLTAGYLSANRSTNATRRSQERSEATKIAESQIEALKSLSADATANIFNRTTFCITSTFTVSPTFSIPALSAENFTTYPPAPGNECTYDRGVIYYASIVRDTSGDGHTFRARVRWNRLGGGDVQQVQIVYRLY